MQRSVRVSEQGVARDDQDKRKTTVKAKKKKKFEPTGYPASRPMHKQVSKEHRFKAQHSSRIRAEGDLCVQLLQPLIYCQNLCPPRQHMSTILCTASTSRFFVLEGVASTHVCPPSCRLRRGDLGLQKRRRSACGDALSYERGPTPLRPYASPRPLLFERSGEDEHLERQRLVDPELPGSAEPHGHTSSGDELPPHLREPSVGAPSFVFLYACQLFFFWP